MKQRVLVVDDELGPRESLKAVFGKIYDVELSENAAQAMEILSSQKIDLVLLDMMMPRIDGPLFVKKVRAEPKLRGLPIFALTSMTRSEVDVPLGPEGVDKWYVKPVNPKALVHDVATYLTNKPVLAT